MKKKKTYEIWAQGYDDNNYATDFDEFVFGSDTAKEAIDKFNEMIDSDFRATYRIPENVKTIELSVEECVDYGDYTECKDVLCRAEL